MRNFLTFGAAALALSIALPAAAQTAGATTSPATDAAAAPPASEPAASDPMAPPSTDTTAGATVGASTGAATNTSASVAVGHTVKDKTGATIGQVTELKPDASGKQMATIKMGADTFAVDTASLAVDGQAATINATQAEIKGMMKK